MRKKGALFNLVNNKEETAFMLSVSSDHKGTFDLLMQMDVDISNVDKKGNNILHYLLKNQVGNIYYYARILAKNPSLLTAENNEGIRPLDMMETYEPSIYDSLY